MPGWPDTAREVDLSVHDDPDELYRIEFDAREFQREIEEAEEQLDRNTRTLADVFIEYMERGDLVEVSVGAHQWRGFVTGVSEDLVSIEADEQTVDVSLDHLRRSAVVIPRHGGGRDFAPPAVASLIARLRELTIASAAAVTVGGPDVAETGCRVVAVSSSHVELSSSDGSVVVVPLRTVGFVARDR